MPHRDPPMTISSVGRLCGLLAVAALLVGSVAPAAAQQGTITGTVIDQAGGAVSRARVLLGATNHGAVTNQQGKYVIAGVAAGTYELRVAIIGYAGETQNVTVEAGQSVTADFRLKPVALSLDAVLVTASGEQRARENASDIARIRAAEVTETQPITNMSDLLSGRAAGINVLPSTGLVGGGSRIRIRGANSVSLSNDPLVVVDGVRMESSAGSYSLYVGGQEPSRINDLNPFEIEDVQIVKGPSAAALYGTQAANGVVLITTKRGTPGKARWNFYTVQGLQHDYADYPDNYGALPLLASGFGCQLNDVAAGTCAQTAVRSFNPLENPVTSPFKAGYNQQYGVNVSGGSEQATYFVSGQFDGQTGVYRMPDREQQVLLDSTGRTELRPEEIRPNYLRKVSVRANLTSRLSDKGSIAVSTGYVSSRLRLPQNDNNVLGIISNGYTGGGLGTDSTDIPTWGFNNGPHRTFQVLATQDVERFTGSAQGEWRPIPWLSARATAGVDFTERVDRDLQRFREGPDFLDFFEGYVDDNRFRIFSWTLNTTATASFQVTPRVSSKTSVGVQYFHDRLNGTTIFAQFLPPGGLTVTSASVDDAEEETNESVTLGSYVEQVLGLNDRLFLTGAVRGDKNSTFGKNLGTVAYPKGSVSWLISDEPFFPKLNALSRLRLRLAYGASGLQPGATDAIRFFDPVTAAADGADLAGVTLAGLGNADLKPERSTEVEAGFDAGLLNDRVGLVLTYYHKKTKDALIAVTTPTSTGFPTSRFENVGSVRNRGFEVVLNLRPVQTSSVSWDLTLSGSTNSNKLLSKVVAGQPDTNPIIFNSSNQRHALGYPLGGYWLRPITSFGDANGDGILTASEVVVAPTEVFMGPSQPTRELSLNTGVTLFENRIRIGGQLDYRGGHKLWNLTEEFRCRSGQQGCRANYDKTVGLEDQAAVVARRFIPPAATRTSFGFIEPGWFIKLRELSVTYHLPAAVARQFRAEQASITLTGRNLATWTDYTGVDPEVNGQGQSSQFLVGRNDFFVRDFATQPPVRYWLVRVSASF
jgi:TonB-linked SusC/RagA family outer membrane protein